jgi:type II secretory pathway component PulF
MPQFRYTARDAQGQLVDGVVTANDRTGAIAQVEQKRYVPIKIQMDSGGGGGGTAVAAPPAPAKPGTSPGGAESTSPSKSATGKTEPSKALATVPRKPLAKKVAPDPNEAVATSKLTLSHSQQYLFSEQLAHLLSAGMTLDESLGVLVKRLKHVKLRALSKSLHQSLLDGRSLSQAMREFPRIFSSLYVNMISAGEASGSLSTILRRLTLHLAEVKALRERVQQALLYPAVLVVIGFLLVLVFMTTMVPQLMSFFKDTQTKLPAATQLLINANNAIVNYWWLGISVVVGGIVLFKAAVANTAGRYAWHRFKWNVPVFSRIPRYRFYAQFARTLGTLTENGVTLLRALELLEDVANNDFIKARMIDVRAAVVDGATLSGALTSQSIFPEMFVDMMGVGEQTGKFSETMGLIADVYERELDKQVQVVSTLIPPMVMVVIAAVIGTVIYGILVAVFNLTGGMSRGR